MSSGAADSWENKTVREPPAKQESVTRVPTNCSKISSKLINLSK